MSQLTTPLLIIGVSGRSAAQSAVRGALEPQVLDAFADVDTQRTCFTQRIPDYPTGFVSAALAKPPGDWLYTGGLENHPRLVDQVSARHRLLGNAGDVLRAVRDPWQVADALAQAGLPVAELVPGDTPPSGGEYLRKQRRSGGGLGILQHAPARGLVAEAGDPAAVYFQQRLTGPSFSATYLTDGSKALLLGLTRQWIGRAHWGARGFQYAGSCTVETGPCPAGDLERLGQCLTATFGLRGIFGVDLVQQDGQMYAVEVNPRYTASCELLERQLSLSFVREHVLTCRAGVLSLSVAPEPRRSRQFGKAILYARVSTSIGIRFLQRVSPVPLRTWPAWADMPAEGESIDTGQPVLTVFASARGENRVLLRLNERIRATQQLLAAMAPEGTTGNQPVRPS